MEPTLTPYLNFNGNAAEAIRYYQSILGGELKMQTFAEAKMAMTPADDERIVHATLVSDAISLMASDTQPTRQAKFGDNVRMSISGHDNVRLTGIFNGLARGGKVDMPLAKQFRGDSFGMATDKFGVQWVVDIIPQPQTW